MIYIYGLFCPVARNIRYIGKSVHPQNRFIAHVTVARNNRGQHHTARWIRKLLKNGHLPELLILERIADDGDWKTSERKWIKKARREGWPLTNSTDGGDAFPPLSDEIRKTSAPKIARTMKQAWSDPERRKRWVTAFNDPDTKKRRADIMRELRLSQEYREKHSAACLLAWSTTERRQIASARSLKMHANPEQKERCVAAIRAAMKRPEAKARLAAAMAEVHARPEFKLKKSRNSKARWQQQEYRDKIINPRSAAKRSRKMSAYWKNNRELMLVRMNDPARTAKISEAMTRRNADPAFRAVAHAPEVHARQAATLKATWAKRLMTLKADPEALAAFRAARSAAAKKAYETRRRPRCRK